MEVETALAVAAEADGPDNMELVALAPSDLLAAQTNLVNWCDQKVNSIRAEAADLRENLRIAKENKWRTATLQNLLNRTEKRIPYYEKIKLAVAAGYLIVPELPGEHLRRARAATGAEGRVARGAQWGTPDFRC
jgi:hypothetical protein